MFPSGKITAGGAQHEGPVPKRTSHKILKRTPGFGHNAPPWHIAAAGNGAALFDRF
jgi:hypothetical protein